MQIITLYMIECQCTEDASLSNIDSSAKVFIKYEKDEKQCYHQDMIVIINQRL